MIIENKINDIIDYKIRVNKNFVPRSANKMLPLFFYSALFIGATGTGKTFKLVELIKLYEKYDILDAKGNKLNIRVVLFCSTANSKANAVYNVLHICITHAPPSLVGKGGHTLLLRGGRRGFDPRQLRRTKRAFFPPLAI